MKKNSFSHKKKTPLSTVHLTPRQVAFIMNAIAAFRHCSEGTYYPASKTWDEEAYQSLTENNGVFDVGRSGIGRTVCLDNGDCYVWKDEFDDPWHGYQPPRVVPSCF